MSPLPFLIGALVALCSAIIGFLAARSTTRVQIEDDGGDFAEEAVRDVYLLQPGAHFTACGRDAFPAVETLETTPRRSAVDCVDCLRKMDLLPEEA